MGTFHQGRLATGHKVLSPPAPVPVPCAGEARVGLLRALSSGMVTVPCWQWPRGESPPVPVMGSMDQVPQSPLTLFALCSQIPRLSCSLCLQCFAI